VLAAALVQLAAAVFAAAASPTPRDSTHANAWPQWSPDGRSIVFASTRDGDWEIYVMATDGTNARRLTRSPGRDAHPSFLPNGRSIVFQSPRGHAAEGQVDLYVMDADGGNQRRLVGAPGFNGVPVPSPDGTWIAFQRGTRTASGDYHWELHLVDSAGRRERQLTANAWSSQVPSWSPDGGRLAFYADPRGRDQLFVLDLRSGAVTALASSAGADNAPAFSPDGRSVAFVSTRDGPRDLYRVDVATGVTRLTTGLDVWAQPHWSPDGSRILVSAMATGVDQLYVVGAQGTGLARLTGPPEPPSLDTPLVLVALSGRDSVVALHGSTLERLFAVATGPDPHEVVTTRDGRRAFVANTRGASVSTIDLSRRAAGPTYALGDGADPHDVELAADDRTLWVTVARQRTLLELDAETGRIRERWPLPAEGGWMVDAGPLDGPVVVAHLEGGGVSVLDRTSRRIAFLPLVPGEIEAVLSPDGATIWSSNMQTDTVTVSAVATRTRLASFPSKGRSPVRVLVTPDGRTAAVANGGGNAVVLLDIANPLATTAIPVPQAPKVLAVSADGHRLYVSHPEPGGVSLIDLVARKLVKTVTLSGAPDGIAVVR
jgi:Tol biopolymer transport system component